MCAFRAGKLTLLCNERVSVDFSRGGQVRDERIEAEEQMALLVDAFAFDALCHIRSHWSHVS